MKKAGIRSIIVKKFRPPPSKEKVEEREHTIKRAFSTPTDPPKMGWQYYVDSHAS